MKYLITIFLFFVASDGFSQDLSKNEFDEKLLSTLNKKYNVKKLPPGFYNCAYSIYEKNKDDGFFVGNNVAIQCLPKYVSKIEFSDAGEKMWKITTSYYKKGCKENNQGYKDKMNVANYCNCLVEKFNGNDIKLKTLISPEFARSNLYNEIATSCFTENRID